MVAQLSAWWERVRTSLWFVPSAMSVAAIALAALVLSQQLSDAVNAWWLYQGTGKDASDLLSTLLAALIPMAALLVSITMVVLTLAAGQLGPRLIRTFMSDVQTQMTLGLFMGTTLYLLIVLSALREGMPATAVPRLGVSIGTLLVLVSVAALLFFIHRLARSIISDTMIDRIGADLDDALAGQLPEEEEPCPPQAARPSNTGVSVTAERGGYVQTVDYESLVTRARDLDVVFELLFRPGHYLVRGTGQAWLWGAAENLDEAREALRSSVVQGGQRNAAQDLEFSVRQFVEIALRALSPGINDEFSAIAVLDRLGGCLGGAIGRPGIHRVLCDRQGRPRVIRQVSSLSGLCAAAFDQIRQAAKGHPAVQMRQIEVVGTLMSLAEAAEEKNVLSHHLDLMIASARRSVSEPHDLQQIEERYRRARPRRLP